MTQEFTIDDCSAGVRSAKPSVVRKGFAMSAKPGMISFASGMPELRSLPLDALADIASDLMRHRGNEVMQYGTFTGTDHLMDPLIELMKIEGIENVTRENALVTTGSQNGLDTLARVMIDPGVRHPRGGHRGARVPGPAHQVPVHHPEFPERGRDHDAAAAPRPDL